MHYEQLCKYVVDLSYYQTREIPPEIQECGYRYGPRQTIITEVKRYVKEFGKWDREWDPYDLRDRIKKGWRFYTFRPKLGIRGWVWVSPRGKIEDLYVSKKYRKKGWGKHLLYQALNSVSDSNWPKATVVCDSWNYPLKYCLEHILLNLQCRVRVSGFEIKKFDNKRVTHEQTRKSRYPSQSRTNRERDL